jgi:hypothetical protein
MSGWLLLGTFIAVVVDLGGNHGAYTRSVLLVARQLLSAIGLV